MSIDLVGFENLPNAFIKDVTITKESSRQNMLQINIRVHDLPDRSIWSSTEELFYRLMRVGVVVSTDMDEITSLTNGEISPTSARYISRSLAIDPQVTQENSLFNLSFSKSIPSEAKNVTVFAFCFISRDDIASSMGVVTSNDYIGPVKSENIIKNMNVVTSTNAFLRQDGSYWAGPVHEHNNGFMEGSYHTDTPHNALTRVSITNTKIKDKRDVIETKHTTTKPIDNFISNLFVSYSSETDVNSIFMINTKALLMKNTKYGSFLSKASQDVVNTILQGLMFKMISLQRQRIKARYRTVGLKSSKRKADMVFHKKNILNTQDDANRRLLGKVRLERNGSYDFLPEELENTSDYMKIADMQELYLDYGSEIRTFQFTDYEMTHKTPGDYQYKIQLQFTDPVDKFLRNTLKIMKTDISDMTVYLNIFARRGSGAGVDAARIVKNYLDHYSYIYELKRSDRVKLSHKYIALLNPSTTDLISISKFLSKYRDLYKDFLVFIDHDDQKNSSSATSVKSRDNMSSRIVVDKVFDEIVTPSNNSFSFSYLPESSNKKTAVFSKTNFFEQAQQQVEEQFVQEPNFASAEVPIGVSSGINDTQTTKTGFFNPTNYFAGRKKGVLASTIEAANSLNKSRMGNIIRKNRKPQATLEKTVSFEPSFLIIEPVPAPVQETEEGQFIEADQVLGSGHEFVSYTETEASFNKPSIMSKPQQKISNALSGYNKRTFRATLEVTKKITPEEAKILPNQLKAVINGQSDATRSNFVSNGNDLLAHPTTKNYFEVKNFSVKEAIYVDHFERDSSGNILLNKPVYKTLMLDNFERLSRPTLCFLRDYSNEKFNISGAEDIQAVNSVFLISDRDVTVPSIESVSPVESIYDTQDIEYQFMSSNIVKQTNTAVRAPIASVQERDDMLTAVLSNRFFGSY